jgi:hypothetical protein
MNPSLEIDGLRKVKCADLHAGDLPDLLVFASKLNTINPVL